MPLIKIDGQEIECKAGATVWQAAAAAGLEIPNYCYHPGLSIAGNCRICLVEVQGMPKLTIACATQIFEAPLPRKVDGKYDMVVSTQSPKVEKARESVMEFLLVNHPLDCPICDQAGECKLQQYAFDVGKGESRMVEQKVLHDKRVQLGPNVVFDGERCIKCTRCIRFCDEVTQTKELGLFARGEDSIIATYPGRALDNPYSVCTVDLCPVGALTFDEFRFASRVWFLKENDSLCLGCARGCNIYLATKQDEVYRFTPRYNAEVNQWWMCDYGRLGFKGLQADARSPWPVFRLAGSEASANGGGEPLPVATALLKLQARPDLSRATPDSSVLIGSARCSLEELQALSNFAAAVFPGSPLLAPLHEKGEDDNLLIRKDKTPNRKGAELLGLKATGVIKPADLKEKKFLLVVREDLFEDCATDAERDALRKAVETIPLIIVLDDRDSATSALADYYFPLRNQAEEAGTYLNFEGRAQRTRAAVLAPDEVRALPELLARLGELFGAKLDFDPARMLSQVSAKDQALAGQLAAAATKSSRIPIPVLV